MTPFFRVCAFGISIALAVAVFFALFNLTLSAKPGLPVGFGSWDELVTVRAVALWASRQVGRHDPHYRTLANLGVKLDLSAHGYFPLGLQVRALSRSELEILAPFIDETIEGRGQPWLLPAEYDHRSEELTVFKTRMQQEGLWPKSAQLSA
jgi:hypothetical protein